MMLSRQLALVKRERLAIVIVAVPLICMLQEMVRWQPLGPSTKNMFKVATILIID